jgi:glycosyltransferase involved in cell wall biosynthesis
MLLERLLIRDCFEVHYVARFVSSTYVAEGYAIHHVPSLRAIAGSFVLDTPALLRVLGQVRPHVIYQRVACAYTGVAAYFARRNHARMVWHVCHDRDLLPLPPRLTFKRPMERLNKCMVAYGARAASAVIVQSANQAAMLRKEFDRTDATQISNCHPDTVGSFEKASDRLIVTWVGNIKESKNPDAFLRLAGEFRHRPDVQFVMVGAPQMSARSWQGLRAKIGSHPNVAYVGSKPHAEVEELLACAHVLVNTSPLEGFPNTFIEAWMREVPVLSLHVNPDGVFDDDYAGICALGSYDRLRNALDTLLSDCGLRRRMGQRAAVYARQRFSIGNLDRLISVLEQN